MFLLVEREGGFDIMHKDSFCGRAVKRASTWIISLKGRNETIRELLASDILLSLEGLAKD